MTVGMWFTADLANLLQGIALAALAKDDSDYQAGFQAALIAVAVALGIPLDRLTDTLAARLPERRIERD